MMEDSVAVAGEQDAAQSVESADTVAFSAIATFLNPALTDKMVAYQWALSFQEFMERTLRYAKLLQDRRDEVRLSPQQQVAAVSYSDQLYILALAPEDDPDTVAVLPLVARLVDAAPRLELRILTDTDSMAPLSTLLPDVDLAAALDEWELPQFFVFDEEWDLQAQWGPRPAGAESYVETWLTAHPEYEQLESDETSEGQGEYARLLNELVYEMRVWFNNGLNSACLDEWCELLSSLQGTEENDEAVS